MSQKLHSDIIKLASKGDPEAMDVLKTIGQVVRVWDDLYDKDTDVKREFIDNAFAALSFDLGKNPFFREHRDRFETAIFLAWNAWSDANLWESDPDDLKKSCAWFIRDYINEVTFLVAWLKGGTSHVRKISSQVRHFYLCELAANETRLKEKEV